MRRSKRDVEHLYKCYCRAWESDNLERTKRIENHNWVTGVWIRDYDNVVRMSPTERGKDIVRNYRACENFDEISLTTFFEEI